MSTHGSADRPSSTNAEAAPDAVGTSNGSLRRRGIFGTGARSASAWAMAATTPGSGGNGVVAVDTFADAASTDDTVAIRRAIEEARRLGSVVSFSGREYRISDTIDLPTGIRLIGAGAVLGPGPATLGGTVLRRIRDCVLLRARGRTFLHGGPMRHSIAIYGIRFDGDDHPSDMLELVSVSRIKLEDCVFIKAKGRHLLLWEAFDCRITNVDFEWGGMPGRPGTPMIELRSGQGREYTNQIHFVGCRCESYPGTAIALTGVNTNEIFFTNCKFESLLPMSIEPALFLSNANVVRFDGVQITSKGSRGSTIRALLVAHESAFLTGDLLLEHIDGDGQASALASYVDIGSSQAVDLKLYVYDGSTRLAADAYVAYAKGYSNACTIKAVMKRGNEISIRTWSS